MLRANVESWRRQRDPLTDILVDAQRRGDIDQATDLAVLQLQLICPVMIAASIIRQPMTNADIDTLIDQTLTGSAPRERS